MQMSDGEKPSHVFTTSILDYCNFYNQDNTEILVKSHQVSQNAAARVWMQVKRRDSYSPVQTLCIKRQEYEL